MCKQSTTPQAADHANLPQPSDGHPDTGHSPTEPAIPAKPAIASGGLRFTADAWAKLLWFRDRPLQDEASDSAEIGGFGVTATSDPLLITDFVTVRQRVTSVSVEFDDQAVADYFDAQVDRGLRPDQFARIWLHTHPGGSAQPSLTDEQTFSRVFGPCDWACMFILAMTGKTYARLRFNAGPGGEIAIPVGVDFTAPFPGSDHLAWEAEYQAHILRQPPGVDLDWLGVAGIDERLWLDQYDISDEALEAAFD